jgi:hypothetical protein
MYSQRLAEFTVILDCLAVHTARNYFWICAQRVLPRENRIRSVAETIVTCEFRQHHRKDHASRAIQLEPTPIS